MPRVTLKYRQPRAAFFTPVESSEEGEGADFHQPSAPSLFNYALNKAQQENQVRVHGKIRDREKAVQSAMTEVLRFEYSQKR
jgi:hypothetical protein